jgi:hypothetical protein
MNSRHRQSSLATETHRPPTGPASEFPEWLERVRLTVENEPPLMQALMRRAISAVLDFAALSEEAIVNATAAPTNLTVLVRALSSSELLEDLKAVEPLAPAFIRGIEAKRRLIEEHGGTLTAEYFAQHLGISRQAVEKRRRAGKLIALAMGRHGYRYPVWQLTESGVLPGLDKVLAVLASHDEWMQTAFFLSANPRLGDRTPVETLKAGEVERVLDAAEAYGEHGAA